MCPQNDHKEKKIQIISLLSFLVLCLDYTWLKKTLSGQKV